MIGKQHYTWGKKLCTWLVLFLENVLQYSSRSNPGEEIRLLEVFCNLAEARFGSWKFFCNLVEARSQITKNRCNGSTFS